MSFVSALTQAILPVLAIAGVGFLLGRVRDIDVDALSTVTIYILTPALVFSSLATSSLGGGAVVSLVIGVVAFTVLIVGVAEAVATAIGETGAVRSGLVLTSAFPNAGNYGIPLSAFAFGAVGRSTAILFISVQAVLMYTLGVYVASRGTLERWTSAFAAVFKLPLVYAVLAAGVARFLDVVPPATSPAMEAITLTGNAAIPVMLVMLGIQLANTDYGTTLSRVWAPVGLKVVLAPLLAIGVALLLDFANPVVGRVFVLECAMPAAITPLMLTIEYRRDTDDLGGPAYVSTAIFASTVLSVPVLAVLITLLQTGVIL
ncbi:MAG: AEC family transporter [Halodesulfurarchaeum sp.]